jgi:subtilisin-like proprotein convertase family protein
MRTLRAVPLVLLAVVLVGGGAQAAGDACTTSTFTSAEAPRAIPDPGAASSSVAVPGGAAVTRVAATASVTHPFDSDLRLELVSPRGKAVLLAEALGTWGDDYAATTFDDDAATSIVSSLPPFAGRHRPVEPLAALAGSPRAGTWRLRVSDRRGRYAGRIESWGLELVSCEGQRPPRPRAGAPTPPALPRGVPAGREPAEGRVVTVTSAQDVPNGNVTSVDALEASPGPDGISLREALLATNNDPGTYTIRFAASLASVPVSNEPLPVLTGGGVFVDGDADGDGRPDVTLAAPRGRVAWAFNVASSGNRLHALALRGFGYGVVLTAMRGEDRLLLKGRTFARNVMSGLVLSDVDAPITPVPTLNHPECERTPCRTRNRWPDTRIVGNTIESRSSSAIWLGWVDDSGDAMRRVTVAGNRIRVSGRGAGIGISEGNAIDVAVGYRRTSDNRISDALVAYNAIALRGGKAIQVLAGQQGRSGNVVEDVRIVGNTVRFAAGARGSTEAIPIYVSDGCWPPDSDCRNAVRRIEVVGNVLEGSSIGVRVAEPCCATFSSNVTDVRIAGNVIRTVVSAPGQFLNPWGVVIGGSRLVSKVAVDSNTIVQRPAVPGAARLSAGIAVLAGLGKSGASIREVAITNNRVDTRLAGIVVIAGATSGQFGGRDRASGNVVSRVTLLGNVIVQAPSLAARWDRRIKGISVIGGSSGAGWLASGNSVICVVARDNFVAGRRADVALLSNVGARASGNVVRLGRC